MRTNSKSKQTEMSRTMKSVENGRLAKQLYQQHGSFKEVSKILGVSTERVRQMIQRADRYAMRPSWLEGLDEALAQILIRDGFTSKDQVRSMIDHLELCPSIGPIRLARVRAWLKRGKV